MYWDFPLCTMILCLLPDYQKKNGAYTTTVPEGFICFLLCSPSTYSLISSQTQLGDQHPKHTEASVTKWEWRPPRPPWERLQWEFKLYLVCKGATVWHKPVTRKGDRNVLQGTPATHLKRWWLLWGLSALNFKPITVSFRRSSPGSPRKGLLGIPFSRPPGNISLQMGLEWKQEQKQQLILEAAEGFLLRCSGITERFLRVFVLCSCEGSSGTFYVNRNSISWQFPAWDTAICLF